VQKQSTFFEKHFVAKDVPLSVASPGDPCKVCASAAKQVTELVAWFRTPRCVDGEDQTCQNAVRCDIINYE
jgi:hypothetical protein